MVEIKTSGGYKIKLQRDYLTFGERVKTQKMFFDSVVMKNETSGQSAEMRGSTILDVQKYVFEQLAESITTPESKEIKENLYDYLLTIPGDEGIEIMNQIDKITAPKEASGKKNS